MWQDYSVREGLIHLEFKLLGEEHDRDWKCDSIVGFGKG